VKDCKHILAARLVQERERLSKAPAIDTDVLPKKPTYSEHRPRYNLTQTAEKHRFQVLLHDLCRNIVEPPQTSRGRPYTSLPDVAFAAVFKVYSTFSSRGFNCDLEYATEAGYLLWSVHPNRVNCFLEMLS